MFRQVVHGAGAYHHVLLDDEVLGAHDEPESTHGGMQGDFLMNIDDQIAEEWRDLGFWYRVTPESGWEFRGSAEGLSRFVAALRAYAADPRNAAPSEHEHFGPYQYLEVCTMERPDVNEHCIQGTLGDIARLASLLESRLGSACVGARFDLAAEYCSGSSSPLVVQVEADGFDPASCDPDRGRRA